MDSLPNSENQNEMAHKVAFHRGLHYLLRLNRSSEKEIYTQLQKKPISHFSGNFLKTELRNENICIPQSLTISSASIH